MRTGAALARDPDGRQGIGQDPGPTVTGTAVASKIDDLYKKTKNPMAC